MKQTRTYVTALIFVLGVAGAFAFKPAKLVLDPRANDGSCTSGNLDSPGSGHTCAKQTSGHFCTVTISGTPWNAYDASCTTGNEIKYN